MRENTGKRVLSRTLVAMLLVVLLVFSMVPLTAFAEDADTTVVPEVTQGAGEEHAALDEEAPLPEGEGPEQESVADGAEQEGFGDSAEQDDTATLAEESADSAEPTEPAALAAPAEVAPATLDGIHGLTAASIEADTPGSGGANATTIDLLSADSSTRGYFSYSTGNGVRKTAYPLAISANFPTGATITDKEIEIILPVALTWVSDGSGVLQNTQYLTSISGSQTYSSSDYGVAGFNRGRVYSVGTSADPSSQGDVGLINLSNLTVKRNEGVADQSFSGDQENTLTVIARWKENGVEKSESVSLSNLTLTEFYPGYSSDFTLTYGNASNSMTESNYNVVPGSQSARIAPAASRSSLWFKSMSFDLKVTYDPVGGGTADIDDLDLSFPDASGRGQWILAPSSSGASGEYTVTTAPGYHTGNSEGLYDMIINLSSDDLKQGDKITITASNFTYDFFKGLNNIDSPNRTTGEARGPAPRAWSYTILEPKENVEIAGIAGSDRGLVAVDYPSLSEGIYKFRVRNMYEYNVSPQKPLPAGSVSTPKTITIDMTSAAGQCVVTPARMTLPAAAGHVVTDITYTLASAPGEPRTISGSWTGNSTHQILLTLADFPGLTETDWLNSISYNMGSFPVAVSGYCALYGEWIDKEATIDPTAGVTVQGGGAKDSDTSKILISISETDDPTNPDTTREFNNVYNWVGYPAGTFQGASPGATINAGSTITAGATDLRISEGDVLTAPVFSIRQPTDTGSIDLSTLSIVQLRGNKDITSLFDITDVTASQPDGVTTYMLTPTQAALDSGTSDLWLGTAAYLVENGSVEINPRFMLKVSFEVSTQLWEPAAQYLNRELFLAGSTDEHFTLVAGTGWQVNNDSGLVGSTNTLTILAYQNVISTVESKLENEPESAYSAVGSYTLNASDRESISLRTNLANYSGQPVDRVTYLIPIPKKDENWGQYSNNAAFPFSMNLAGELVPSANATADFTIEYGTVTPGGDGAAIEASFGWGAYDASNKDAYNCIKITAVDLPYTSAGGTAEEDLLANTFSFTAALSVPYSDTIEDDMVNQWSAALYTQLLGNSGWTRGADISVRTLLGDMAGIVWLDANRDGIKDSDEPALGAGWELLLLEKSVFDTGYSESDFLSDPVGYLKDRGAQLATTEEAGTYSFSLLNRGAEYVLLAVNKDVESYRFTRLGTDTEPADMELAELTSVYQGAPYDGKTIYPAAYLITAKPGLYAADTGRPERDGKGVYDVGLKEFTLETLTVTYDANGGSGNVPLDDTEYQIEDEVIVLGNTGVPGALSIPGYRFDGWNTAASGAGTGYAAGDDFIILENTTLYAQWAREYYTVTFVDWNGTTLATRTGIPYGGAALAPSDPVRAGYIFDSWDKAFDYITSNLVVTALYLPTVIPPEPPLPPEPPVTPVEQTYTITFVDYNGTVLQSTTVNAGESVTPPANPTRSGFRFTGWDQPSSVWTNVQADATIRATYDDETTVMPPVTTTIDQEEEPLGGTPEEELAAAALEQGIPTFGVPLSAPQGFAAWALANLIMMILSLAAALVFGLVRVLRRNEKREDEDEEERHLRLEAARQYGWQEEEQEEDARKHNRSIIWLVATIVVAVIGLIFFILTEDITLPMVWVDGWTIIQALLLVVSIVLAAIAVNRRKEKEEEEAEESTAQATL